MHGGPSLAGAESPRFRHGYYTRTAIAARREIAGLIARAPDTVDQVNRDRATDLANLLNLYLNSKEGLRGN